MPLNKTHTSTPDAIRLRGVRQNNLRGIDCDIPLGQLTVVTGVSGSGKSSLAFETLYAEGQRRYIETFSAYTRQFLDRMARPDADLIEGIPPAVAIDQAGAIKTSRSTVGTLTGINDYLKLLFARLGEAFCPRCGRRVVPEGTAAVLAHLETLEEEDFPALVVASVPLGGFDSTETVIRAFTAQGYLRFLRDGEVERIEALTAADLRRPSLPIVADRLTSSHATRARRADSVEAAFRVGRGTVSIVSRSGTSVFASGLQCGPCGLRLLAPTPGLFSFNNPYGACPRCRGFGRVIELDLRRVIPDPRLALRDGAIKPFSTRSTRPLARKLAAFCEREGIPFDVPWGELGERERGLVIEGGTGFGGVRGFFRRLEEKKYKLHVRVLLARYRGYETCPDCRGARLRPEALLFRVGGRTIADVWNEPIHALHPEVEALARAGLPRPVALVVEEVASRLKYLGSVGLGYLTLGRQARTLSGGEVERVNLTSALGAELVSTLFVLDEPSIGLHARDNDRLIQILREVRDRGNTVVVVEHDPAILRAADHLVDLGPGSGEQGGNIVAAGPAAAVVANDASLTGAYLSGRRAVPRPAAPRPLDRKRCLRVRGAAENNLRDLDVDLPLEGLVVLTGVSGSGKSTLLEDILWRSYRGSRGEAVEGEVKVRKVEGFDLVDEVVLVDQSPLGRTPRGNAATYTRCHDAIRKHFAASIEARLAGLTARHFSFNVEGGRCPECAGAGAVQVEMQFLSDVTLACEACGGKRFRPEVLRVRCRGKTIDEVLALTIREAAVLFRDDIDLAARLDFLDALGLGYVRLGQPLSTLSGGEAQRLKLAARVLATRRGKLLFLLDEPTTGLHLEDVAKLLEVLRGLVERGHGVIVIEHHLDVIAAADWLVDLGPEGGDEGGRLVAAGTPAEVARDARRTGSITGAWLSRHLQEAAAKAPTLASGRPPAPAAPDAIRVVGARENNLKDIAVAIPRGQLVVVTGPSGSGKSSLVHDIVFAEGQRRYLDCMSPYARQFVEELRRPDIDHLEGIPPTVAIEQRTSVGGRKSTVGTVTEVYQFLRLLYTRAGVQMCPDCGVDVVPRREEDIAREVERLAARGGRVLAPVLRGKKGFHSRLLREARQRGILDARIDGEWIAIPGDRELRLDRHRAHDVDLVVGRLPPLPDAAAVRKLVSQALGLGNGTLRVVSDAGVEDVLSAHRSCPQCGRDFEEPDPRNFSFHSRHGACAACDGYGVRFEVDPERVIERWDLPLEAKPDGPLAFLEASPFPARARARFLRAALPALERAGAPLEKPLARWPRRALAALLGGDGAFSGLVATVDDAVREAGEDDQERLWSRWGREAPCPECAGTRLRPEWRAVRIAGLSIGEAARRTVGGLREVLKGLELGGRAGIIGKPIVEEIVARLDFLAGVGLEYLTLDRSATTLSTGEAQRIRLAAQLGTNLRGVCYILDEPTIGLHARDAARLLATLRRLRDRGNSVIVVEHDEETMGAADHLIDMGPGPGRHGGEVVAAGTMAEVVACERSATGAYFRRRALQDDDDAGERAGTEAAGIDAAAAPAIEVGGASRHNLKGVAARFPLGAVTVVTGVSGAGKSTLVRDVLEESLRRRLRGLRALAGCTELRGAELVTAVREVDQLPIGRTPRSTPATYVGFWDRIRTIFASTPEARARGFEARRFSFNTQGGRCETCAGQGQIRMEMSFLPDVSVGCEACGGRRFGPETLEVTYRQKSVADVLAMTIEEALAFFDSYGELTRQLRALDDLGLGYLALGQPSTTLSGGEAQRVKLGVELAKSAAGPCLYLLDEPTTGLHLEDVERLGGVLRRLARAGHAVVVIEHHLDVISGADWIVDLGPESGDEGGEVLYQGPPAGLARRAGRSHTARCLAEHARRREAHADEAAEVAAQERRRGDG